MSLPRRLWRLARQTVRERVDSAERIVSDESARHAAEEELDDFLGHTPPGSPYRPPAPPPHPFERQYATLNLPAGSDAESVERAWRRLVLQTHPDRFSHDPAAERAATERLREINQAHDELIAWLTQRGR